MSDDKSDGIISRFAERMAKKSDKPINGHQVGQVASPEQYDVFVQKTSADCLKELKRRVKPESPEQMSHAMSQMIVVAAMAIAGNTGKPDAMAALQEAKRAIAKLGAPTQHVKKD